MVDYFFEVSHGKLDLSASQVFGWLTLETRISDLASVAGDPRGFLVGRARSAAVNAGIDLSPFYGTLVHMNIAGGEGGTKASPYGPWTFLSGGEIEPALIGEEMGHAYGLNHPMEDGIAGEYMDPWDAMSAWLTYVTSTSLFGRIGPIINAANMRFAGWLDESRVYKAPTASSFAMTIRLRPLTRRDLAGWLAVQLPGGYLVEFRMKESWDAGIPRSAILVHRFSSTDNRSYLMHNKVGGRDLAKDDIFSADVGDFNVQLEVEEIDGPAHLATLHIQSNEKPASCSQLLERIEGIKSMISYLQELLQHAAPGSKGDIVNQIRHYQGELTEVSNRAKAQGCDEALVKDSRIS